MVFPLNTKAFLGLGRPRKQIFGFFGGSLASFVASIVSRLSASLALGVASVILCIELDKFVQVVA